jgi:hypothetical protein
VLENVPVSGGSDVDCVTLATSLQNVSREGAKVNRNRQTGLLRTGVALRAVQFRGYDRRKPRACPSQLQLPNIISVEIMRNSSGARASLLQPVPTPEGRLLTYLASDMVTHATSTALDKH